MTTLVSKRVCQCGCGELIPAISKHRGEPARYKHGHNCKGKPNLHAPKGKHHPNWKGGIKKTTQGYIYVLKPEHPRANRRYIHQATLVLEQKLERPLRDDEIPHHINGIRTDNRPENLQAVTKSEHAKMHNIIPNMSSRRCCICGGQTYKDKKGKAKWLKSPSSNTDELFECNRCYLRRIRRKGVKDAVSKYTPDVLENWK